MTIKKLLALMTAICTAASATGVAAKAFIYGEANLSLDYVDAEMNAAWNRPAPGLPAFDMEQFIDDANAVLGEIGYVGVPGPGGVNTAIADVLYGTVQGNFPFDSLPVETQAGIIRSLRDATTVGRPFKGWTVDANDRGSRFGIKGTEDLRGLKAVYQLEIAVEMSGDQDRGHPAEPSGFALRNSFVGLAGGWGTALIGYHDTALKMSTGRLDLFADTLADYNVTVGFDDRRAERAILYLSPSLYGLQFVGTVAPGGGQTLVGPANPSADSLADIWSVAVNYTHGPLYASVAYEVLGDELWRSQEGAYDTTHGVLPSNDEKWRIGLGLLDWKGFTLAGIYESRSDILGMPHRASASLWQIQAAYAFGNNAIKVMYGQADLAACADPSDLGFRYTCSVGVLGQVLGAELGHPIDQQDKSTWAIGVDHNFSKRTMAYALYTVLDDDNPDADWSGFSLGLSHKF